MLKWIDIIKFTSKGNPVPPSRVEKTEDEWKLILDSEQFRVARLKGTERAYSSEMCSLFEPGLYACVCCGNHLFDSGEKFESGSGWPSFTQPLEENVVGYHSDESFGMRRIEALCNICDAHLGHVFPDGPNPSGLRYCINAVSLQKVTKTYETATFGGGCFWCTEAVFLRLKGVQKVESGYSGGHIDNPTYREICSGLTGHAEVIKITFDPNTISYEELLLVFMTTHDPTTLNQQGADRGTQYRSSIMYHDDLQLKTATALINELQSHYNNAIVTEIVPATVFFKAEDYHQNYYNLHQGEGYCQAVIRPKLVKLEKLYVEKLK
jgi:peptide methionine sulfoxide reductase msrA/msrB